MDALAGSSTLITGIGLLSTQSEGGELRDAAVVVQNGAVVWVGPASSAPTADRSVDVGGRAVIPGFVDSHAHLVFARDRAA